MTIIDFAEQNKLKVSRDPEDGTDIVRGKHDQSHIYEWDDTELAVMFVTPVTKPARTFYWRKYRDSGIAAGMRLIQNGDAEGCLGFDSDSARPGQDRPQAGGGKDEAEDKPQTSGHARQVQIHPATGGLV